MLGDHGLSVAALDSALDATKTGQLVLSEALTVRARALVGRRAAHGTSQHASGPHWSEQEGADRLREMVGRMAGQDKALSEKLVLGGL